MAAQNVERRSSAGFRCLCLLRIEQVGYQKYSGKYEIRNGMLGGVYSDGKPFGSTYDITFDESGNTLTLTSATGVAETGVYVRAAIPDGVKNGAAVMKSSRTVPIRLL